MAEIEGMEPCALLVFTIPCIICNNNNYPYIMSDMHCEYEVAVVWPGAVSIIPIYKDRYLQADTVNTHLM